MFSLFLFGWWILLNPIKTEIVFQPLLWTPCRVGTQWRHMLGEYLSECPRGRLSFANPCRVDSLDFSKDQQWLCPSPFTLNTAQFWDKICIWVCGFLTRHTSLQHSSADHPLTHFRANPIYLETATDPTGWGFPQDRFPCFQYPLQVASCLLYTMTNLFYVRVLTVLLWAWLIC